MIIVCANKMLHNITLLWNTKVTVLLTARFWKRSPSTFLLTLSKYKVTKRKGQQTCKQRNTRVSGLTSGQRKAWSQIVACIHTKTPQALICTMPYKHTFKHHVTFCTTFLSFARPTVIFALFYFFILCLYHSVLSRVALVIYNFCTLCTLCSPASIVCYV